MKITFLGGVQTVTGSKYLLEEGDTKILVDCGMFQGNKETRKRNWDPFPIDPRTIDAIVLTHAHIDHSGYIPVLVKNGFTGKIYCSKGTYELCEILLRDSGFLQEQDAEKINKEGYSEHKPALPLYTVADAEHALGFFKLIDYDTPVNIGPFTATLIASYHILGASFIVIANGQQKITFSGDLGRPDELIMQDPPHLPQTDYLVIESTYGNRLHVKENPIDLLGNYINRTVAKGGVVIIPSFAVGRAQTILYCLYQLKQQKRIPDIPIYLDSPMAINVTDLFCKFKAEHKLATPESCKNIFDVARYTRTVDESKAINHKKGSSIIIAGSGMASGGRVLHHLKQYLSDPNNTIIFVGFQAEGTNGRELIEGASELEIYGKMYEVHAAIKKINTLSAHADYEEILDWMSYFKGTPKTVFVTHGEIEAAESLKRKIKERFGWRAVVPKYKESFELD